MFVLYKPDPNSHVYLIMDMVENTDIAIHGMNGPFKVYGCIILSGTCPENAIVKCERIATDKVSSEDRKMLIEMAKKSEFFSYYNKKIK